MAEQNLKRLTTVNLDRLVAPRHITEDLDTDPETDVVHFIAVLIESLAMLKKLPEAIEVLVARNHTTNIKCLSVFSYYVT